MSVRGDMLADLVASLEAMSIGNGYQVDWKPGYDELPESPPELMPAWALVEGVDSAEEMAYPLTSWRSSIEIHGGASEDKIAGADRRGVADGMIADIVRAVMADPTRGGHAIDTKVVSAERISVVAPDVWVVVTIEVLWRASLTDPRQPV